MHDFRRQVKLDDGRSFRWLEESQQWEDMNTGVRISEIELQNLEYSIAEAPTLSEQTAPTTSPAASSYGSEAGGQGPEEEDPRLLVNGDGFLSDYPDYGFVGTPGDMGYTASPIVAWTQMPYLTYEDDFFITLSAYHINDIDKVEFSLNGGATATCASNKVGCPVKNPWGYSYNEYYAKIPASSMPNGYHEIRAVVHPKNAGQIVTLQGRTEVFFKDLGGATHMGATFDHTGATLSGNIEQARHIRPNSAWEELLSGGARMKGKHHAGTNNGQGLGIGAEGFFFNTNTNRVKVYVDPGFAGTTAGTLSAPYNRIEEAFEDQTDTDAKAKAFADGVIYLKTPSGAGSSGYFHEWPRENFNLHGRLGANDEARRKYSNAATGGVPISEVVEKVVDIVGLPDNPNATDGSQYVQMKGFSAGDPEGLYGSGSHPFGFSGGARIEDMNVRFKGLWFKPDFMSGGHAPVIQNLCRVSLQKAYVDDCYFSRGNTYRDSSEHIGYNYLPIQTVLSGATIPGGVYAMNNVTWGTAYLAKFCKLAKHNVHIKFKGDMYPGSPGAVIANCWHIYHTATSSHTNIHTDMFQYSNSFHQANRLVCGNILTNGGGQIAHMAMHEQKTRYRDTAAGIDFPISFARSYGFHFPMENFAQCHNELDIVQSSNNLNMVTPINHCVIDSNNFRKASYSWAIGGRSWVGGNGVLTAQELDTGTPGTGVTAFGACGGFSGPTKFTHFRFTNNLQGKVSGKKARWEYRADEGVWGTGDYVNIFSGADAVTWGTFFNHDESRCSGNHILQERVNYENFFKDKTDDTTFGDVRFRRVCPDLNWCDSAVDDEDPISPRGVDRPIGCPTDIRNVAGAPGFEKCDSGYTPHIWTQSAESFRDANLGFFSPLVGGTSDKNMETTHRFYTPIPRDERGVDAAFKQDMSYEKNTSSSEAPTEEYILAEFVGLTMFNQVEDMFGFSAGDQAATGAGMSGDSAACGSFIEPNDIVGAETGDGLGFVVVQLNGEGAIADADLLAEVTDLDKHSGADKMTDAQRIASPTVTKGASTSMGSSVQFATTSDKGNVIQRP